MMGFLWPEAPPSSSLTVDVTTGAFLSYVPATDWQLLHRVRFGDTYWRVTLCPLNNFDFTCA